MNTNKKIIVIGISSGIAAYKVIDLIKILKKEDIDIVIIMTQHAAEMISVADFEKASENKIYTQLYPAGFNYKEVLEKKEVEHIKIADGASLFVIVPATANIIGKISCGIADDFLTTTLLAATCPVLICPSMNVNMWNNPIVQDNLEKLKKLDYHILPPDKGQLACGYQGVGRLAHSNNIAAEIFNLLKTKKRLAEKKIIVTAGSIAEPIDAVRVITNRASGKMGLALAEECHQHGAKVLLIRSNTAVSSRLNIKEETFETTKDLENLIKKHVKDYDAIFHTAAVSDFVPEKYIDGKLDSKKSLNLILKPAAKILHQIKTWNSKIKLIGFKAVYKLPDIKLIKKGIEKLKESKSDYIIVNDVGREGVGFAVDTNEVYIISSKGLIAKIDKAPKKEIARKILDYIFD